MEELLVLTASLVAVLAGAKVRASEQQLTRGVGATENAFAVHDNYDLFDLDNKSVSECLYGENNNRDDSKQDAKLLEFLDPVKVDSNNCYCHAAISTPSELEIAKLKGEHCRRFSVGPTIITIYSGIPVSSEKKMNHSFLAVSQTPKQR